MRGTVVLFSNAKGWGFLRPDEGGVDVFVHHTGIAMHGYRSLNEGDNVEFEVVTGPKGKPQAANVTLVQRAQPA